MKKFKAYFYNGFGKPKLLATSITGLLRDVTISDNYLGDLTSEMRSEVKGYKNGKQSFEDLSSSLEYYNIYINPTFNSLVEVSKTWFGNDTPLEHFEDFKQI